MLIEKLNKLIDSQATKDIAYQIEINEKIYSYNSQTLFPAASVIKIPITLVNLLEKQNEFKTDKLRISTRVEGTGVLHSLSDIEYLSLWDAISLSIIVSDNTTSNMLIDNVGMKELNLGFNEIGLDNTEVNRHFMDTHSLEKGIDNHITAADALSSIKLITDENKIFSTLFRKKIFEIMKHQQFNDRIGGYLNFSQKNITLASKTGTLNCLEHDIGCISTNEKSVKYSILTKNWKSNQEGKRFLNNVGEIFIDYLEE